MAIHSGQNSSAQKNRFPDPGQVPTQWLRPSIHPAYPRLLCAHLRNKGIEMENLFAGNSLSWDALLTTQRFINFDQFRRLSLRAIALTDCPWIGLEISSMIQVSAHGPLGYGAVAAPTVREAFKLVEWAMPTRLSFYSFELLEENGRALFNLRELMDPEALREFMLAMLLGSFHDMLSKTSSVALSDITVRFPFAEPEWSRLYRFRFPEIRFEFGSEICQIDLPASLLDLHCLTADEFAYRNAVRECEQLLAKTSEGGDLSERIKRRLFELGAPYPSQESIASEMNMSVRTLIRHLKSEQTSYQALLDEVRKELACWFLQDTDTPIDQIAERLGYQDTSNFSRVFRRWMGCTPSGFRRNQTA